jgi:hypothetical protein
MGKSIAMDMPNYFIKFFYTQESVISLPPSQRTAGSYFSASGKPENISTYTVGEIFQLIIITIISGEIELSGKVEEMVLRMKGKPLI